MMNHKTKSCVFVCPLGRGGKNEENLKKNNENTMNQTYGTPMKNKGGNNRNRPQTSSRHGPTNHQTIYQQKSESQKSGQKSGLVFPYNTVILFPQRSKKSREEGFRCFLVFVFDFNFFFEAGQYCTVYSWFSPGQNILFKNLAKI